MEYEEGHDKLKLLVLDCAVCCVNQLSQNESLLQLTKENGSLSGGLLVKMASFFQK